MGYLHNLKNVLNIFNLVVFVAIFESQCSTDREKRYGLSKQQR
jgi:hypothetical protein